MVKYITPEEIAAHNSEKDLWMVINGKVYDISTFGDEHPGGVEILLDYAGQDGTKAYKDVGHSTAADELLEELYVGDLKPGTELELASLKKDRAVKNSPPPIGLIVAIVLVPMVALFVYKNFISKKTSTSFDEV
ncbi:cytochrome b5 [Schizosaccharomyces japonicus yFS275]|uniref:Cytochrome b5 n=1 Tax=Schizosaccharomyces japonicus (strain yFS275 / FY16936) TaxID=402676 RepID=B6K5F4_SCHJY|nr:cytochrome b5 [Schizosaccharomyces japonicus yFS275]EEB08758.2 cytochrome b5 [Schizosaccharomyces japonicus yFS275]